MTGLGRGVARVGRVATGVGKYATVQQKWENVDFPLDKARLYEWIGPYQHNCMQE